MTLDKPHSDEIEQQLGACARAVRDLAEDVRRLAELSRRRALLASPDAIGALLRQAQEAAAGPKKATTDPGA
jgi:predicted extracellular nuclease